MTDPDLAGARLTIDLDAIVANYRLLSDLDARTECAAVVKADAYGLGADRVAPALAAAGCRTFFVAQVEEGIRLRALLPEADIHVLNGLPPHPGTERVFDAHTLIPVLNSLGDVDRWAKHVRAGGATTATLHIDTGMCRLGLSGDELAALAADPGRVGGTEIALVMSHLACADEPDHPMNAKQLAKFRAALDRLPWGVSPWGRTSLANSSGLFLGPHYRMDLARPGVSLYGGTPNPALPNPLAPVVRLQGKIVQLRDVDSPQTVGYGATHQVTGPRRLATVPVGYADGFLRSLSGRGTAFIGDRPVPIVGRVSMDLITLDVTDIPAAECHPGALVDLIGPHNPIDAVAAQAGTIGYEILTSLGARYHRDYVGGGRGGQDR